MDNSEPIITRCEDDGSKYFLFRDSGIEITITIIEGSIKSSDKLFQHEVDYIKSHIINSNVIF
jgi:hypothetical protein